MKLKKIILLPHIGSIRGKGKGKETGAGTCFMVTKVRVLSQ